MITTFEPLDLGVRSWTTLSKSFGERVGLMGFDPSTFNDF